jgi:hypothetical protein
MPSAQTYANTRLSLSSRITKYLQVISLFNNNSEVTLSYPNIWYVSILGLHMI